MHSVLDFSCKPFGSWKKTTPQRKQVTSCRLSPSDPSKSSNKKPHLYLWPCFSCKTNDTFLRSFQEEFQGILPTAFWCVLCEKLARCSLKVWKAMQRCKLWFFSGVIQLLKNTNYNNIFGNQHFSTIWIFQGFLFLKASKSFWQSSGGPAFTSPRRRCVWSNDCSTSTCQPAWEIEAK